MIVITQSTIAIKIELISLSMHFFGRITSLLNKPFPEDESRFGSPKIIILFSAFVVFFLYVFEPFGLGDLESNQFIICLGFGFMTFSASVIYEFIVGSVLKLKGDGSKWTFWKWIVNNLGIMISISLANFLFARLAIIGHIDWELYPTMLYATFMIGILPVVGLGAWSMTRQERKYQGIASEINEFHNQKVVDPDSTISSIFDINQDQIRYVEALQNYVKLGYVSAAGKYATKVERGTLKQILEQSKGSSIVKSHRSFLVNQDAIVSIKGNAQGLILTLSDCETSIPVSRSYVRNFR